MKNNFFTSIHRITSKFVLYLEISDRPCLRKIPRACCVDLDVRKLPRLCVCHRPNFFPADGQREDVAGTDLGLANFKPCPYSRRGQIVPEKLANISLAIEGCNKVHAATFMEPESRSSVSDVTKLFTLG